MNPLATFQIDSSSFPRSRWNWTTSISIWNQNLIVSDDNESQSIQLYAIPFENEWNNLKETSSTSHRSPHQRKDSLMESSLTVLNELANLLSTPLPESSPFPQNNVSDLGHLAQVEEISPQKSEANVEISRLTSLVEEHEKNLTFEKEKLQQQQQQEEQKSIQLIQYSTHLQSKLHQSQTNLLRQQSQLEKMASKWKSSHRLNKRLRRQMNKSLSLITPDHVENQIIKMKN